MNFIAKYLNVIGLVLLFGFATATAAVYFGVPGQSPVKPVVAKSAASPSPAMAVAVPALPAASAGCSHHESAGSGGCCGSDASAPMPEGCPHHNSTK